MSNSVGLIFDLDQTLIDSRLAEPFRKPNLWQKAYEKIPHFAEYDGIKDVLNYVSKNKIPSCIVTSSPSLYCTKVCEHWNIDNSLMVCYHDTPRGQTKPHPAPILLALKKLNLPATRVLSFGDRDIDIISSNQAKVQSVACLWGASDEQSLLAAKPSHTIKIPSEMILLIEQLRINFVN